MLLVPYLDRPFVLVRNLSTAIPTTQTNFTTKTRTQHSHKQATPITTILTFNKFIDQLDPWEKNLFRHTDIRQHSKLAMAINEATKIDIVSDGGMMNNNTI